MKRLFLDPQKHFYTCKGHKSISRQGFDVTTKFSRGTVKKRSYFRPNDPKILQKLFHIRPPFGMEASKYGVEFVGSV